jgi:cell division protein FtsQ
MDDRGRLAQPLKGTVRSRARVAPDAAERARAGADHANDAGVRATAPRVARAMNRWSFLLEAHLPRGLGLVLSAAMILASIAYGVVKGDHVGTIVAALKDARDGAANAAGFRIMSIALAGNHHVSREEVLAVAGVTGTTSLLFLDVADMRERLKTNPWIADATVLKLYPGELQIGVKEREAFALWQKDGRVSVIADDGTVLEPYVAPRLAARRRTRRHSSRCSNPIRSSATSCAPRSWWASGAGTCD